MNIPMPAVKSLVFGIFLSLSTLFFSNAQAQFSEVSETNPDLEYNSIQENFHLHLNKTSFIRSERIWFKAYVYNQNVGKPSVFTSNLHVALFDTEGREVKRKLIYVEQGVGYGDFIIDSTLTESSYYIGAWTNWMKNFERPNTFYDQIEILNPMVIAEPELVKDKDFELHLQPEGGSLLADSENAIGIWLNAAPELIETARLRLVSDTRDTLVDQVNLSSSGWAKLTYVHEKNKKYELHLEIEGQKTLIRTLPEPETAGVSLLVNTLHPSQVYLKIATNYKSLPLFSGKAFRLTLRGRDTIVDKDFGIARLNQVVTFNKNEISRGINLVSLVNEQGKLLASRVFHNTQKYTKELIDVSSALDVSGDSLVLRIRLKPSVRERFSLSISTLPMAARSYNPANSLKSSFELKPYLPEAHSYQYHTHGSDRSQEYEWDALLLNRTLTRFTPSLFPNPKQSEMYNWESGITVLGWAKNADLEREKYLWMFSGSVENTLIGNLRKDKTFETEGILYENDSLAFALVDKKGSMRPPIIEFKLVPEITEQQLDIDKVKYLAKPDRSAIDGNWILPFEIDDQTILLDEVELVERRRPARFQINATTEMRMITDDDINRRHTLLNYIRKLGFHVFMYSNSFVITRYTNPLLARNIPLIIDGMVETSPIVLQTQLSNVQSIVYDPLAFISFRMKNRRYRNPDKKAFTTFPVETGFAKPSEYIAPPYSNYDNRFFMFYGTIDWQPMLWLNDQEEVSFKIPRWGQNEFKLIIEGMGSDGTLISTEEVIRVKSEK